MTDDAELIARLRELDTWVETADIPDLAADRIEALTEQLAAARQDAKEAEAYAEELERELRDTQDRANAFATKEYYTKMRAERAEAKLAKAVAFLEEIAITGDWFTSDMNDLIKELKGESHD